MGDIPFFVSSIISYVGPILPASNGISPIFLFVALECLAHLTRSSLNPACLYIGGNSMIRMLFTVVCICYCIYIY